ncbi:MAG: putative rane protein [Ramlibacter sp.]|nr:putative rane protein [Ramlibacter sp.]
MKLSRSNGFLHWVLPAMLALVAVGALLSGRDMSLIFQELAADTGGYQGPVVVWGQRLVSVLLLAAAGERIFKHVTLHKQLPSPALTGAFVVYWAATVATPAIFGSHPQLAHEYLYALVLGFAVLLVSQGEGDRVLRAARDALLLFIVAGLLLVPVLPAMVMDQSYTQGLLPGVPRFGGLAPHPVAMGMFAQTALLLLWARPFQNRWLNLGAWLAGGGALFFAQSKTAWIAFLLCSACMLAVRHGARFWQRVTDPRQGAFGIVACLCAIIVLAGILGWVTLGDLGTQLDDFANTAQGAQLMSMTGRDQIWAVAIEEWHASPLFGYGPGLWDSDFRASIGMPNATDAHNQFMDTLARSGSVGAAALVLYACVLLVLSLRYAKTTGGLSLALFLALALRSISEVPLLLFGYGTDLYSHLLLLATLAGAASARTLARPVRASYAYGTAS